MTTRSATTSVPPPALRSIRSGRAAPREDIPRLAFDAFRQAVVGASRRRGRVAALFGAPGPRAAERSVELFAVLAFDTDGHLEVGSTVVDGGGFPSMTVDCPEVHLFEREIAESWSVVPHGHPRLVPVRRGGQRDFFRIEGVEVHEVAVGPVHAGVIEPGHFRFQCHGEEVFHLEIALGYQHRGVERALRGGPGKRTVHLMETLAGDSSIAHATAYCHLVESLGTTRVPARAHALRGVALELERIANHVGTLGGLANDVAFLPTASFCGRLRGDFLNLTAQLCGSRFGRGLVRPGGVAFDVDAARAKEVRDRATAAARDVKAAVDLLWNAASVQARFEGTGTVTSDTAAALGLVGVAARASGLERDVRHDHPSGVYRLAHIPVSVWHTGDVFARAYVRWLEIERSIAFVRDQLSSLPAGPVRSAPAPGLAPERLAVSLVEGTRGEVCHVALTDEAGRFDVYKVYDPSFHDWSAVALALRGQDVSDFPLCNKSFDLSYCGHDL